MGLANVGGLPPDEYISRSGAWICVDGVEGTGKTTVTNALADSLPVVKVPEFSTAPFGHALREAVRTTPHHISTSPLGQSLVFLGDFLEVYASSVAPRLAAGRSVVSDRGYLSKYAYQEVVLAPVLGLARTRRLLAEVFDQLPPPTLTVYLTAPEHRVRERLLRRDGHCEPTRLAFIRRAAYSAGHHLSRNPDLVSVTVDTDPPVADVVRTVEGVVRGYVRPHSS